jgi:hypothetical protein
MKGEGETQQKIADALVCRDRDRAQDAVTAALPIRVVPLAWPAA